MKSRKYLILICLLLVSFSCNQRADVAKFSISGKVDNLDGAKVYLSQNLVNLDSADIRDGKFSLEGSVWNYSFVEITFYSREVKDKNTKNRGWLHPITFFAEKDAYYKFFAKDSSDIFNHTYWIETNSASQRQFYNYDRDLHSRNRELKQKLSHYERLRDKALISRNYALDNALSDSLAHYKLRRETLISDMQKEIINANPNSYLSIYLLSKTSDIENNLDFYVSVEKRLKGEYRQHEYTQKFIKRLSKFRTDIPIKLRIDANDESGNPFDLSKFNDKKLIVIDFWATWCAPCIETMPSALQAKKLLEHDDVAYIFLSYDSRVKTWLRQSKELGLSDSYLIKESAKSYLDQTLNMATIPRYVIMDNKGNVRTKYAPSPDEAKFFDVVKILLSKVP